MTPEQVLSLDEINLSDPEFWLRPIEEREGAFLTLRNESPIHFFEEPEVEMMERGRGYWALTRYADILEASKTPGDFCSGAGTNIPDLPPPFIEFFGSMINMDDPKHARMRKIVARQFTPKKLAEVEAMVDAAAAEVVDEVIEKGSCDFVTEVAARLPLRIIDNMMGIPREMEDFIFEKSNLILGAADPEYVPSQEPTDIMMAMLGSGQELANLVTELGSEREKNPKDDLTTALVTTDIDGEKLSPQELGSFFILLVVAGNETTRNAIAHGLWALTQHPEQLEKWKGDFEGLRATAVEEIVRWATPVIHFRRTATRDGVKIGDQTFNEGDKVVLFYNSGNRDDLLFDRPFDFDITRDPNPHIGFGGPGPHFCLGAHLARREISVMYKELFKRLPGLHASGPPEKLASSFIHGVKHLPAAW